ncbi:hypothetical protein LPB67_06105 [Undibacterium sp. Jales W-56]|uniref:hypothetical protein n=1 Tax=Undibacterium sp. Jales W-56 TaxID=2897325 RepID=UPI0021D06C50|nr:hypothetical protein [Undibacterium sp. Jales W-56]MCU6433351.1 hypothetical protein [Undibacterium sp. Jales W-56]
MLLASYLIISIVIGYLIMSSYQGMSPKIPAGFLTPRHAHGHATFMTTLDDLTAMSPAKIKALCLWLGICAKTMSRYISGASPVPHAICYAMFFESQWGRDAINAKAVNDHDVVVLQLRTFQARCRALEAENARLSKQILDTSPAANAPTYQSGERVISTGKDIHIRSETVHDDLPLHAFSSFKIAHSRHRR